MALSATSRLTAFVNGVASGARYGAAMLFLLNDRILDLNTRGFQTPLDPARFHALTIPFVMKLGQELFSESPLLHRDEPERAKRLAQLILVKAPEVNAALFVAPARGCRPDEVTSRFANLSIEVMASLTVRERQGDLNPVTGRPRGLAAHGRLALFRTIFPRPSAP